MIGRFWIVHHRFFGDVAWIVLIPFSSQVLGDHAGDTDAVVLYAANLAGVVLAGMLLFVDARRAGLARTDPRRGRRIAAHLPAHRHIDDWSDRRRTDRRDRHPALTWG